MPQLVTLLQQKFFIISESSPFGLEAAWQAGAAATLPEMQMVRAISKIPLTGDKTLKTP